MTQLPPPVGSPVDYGRPLTPPPQSNAWAIVSLICGIIGCFVVTPIAAIVTGVVGLSKAKRQGGRGMAIAGIVLGVVWLLIGVVAIGGGVTLWKNAASLIAYSAKPQTIQTINRIGAGNTTRDPSTAGLSDSDVQSIVDAAARLGQCHDISINRTVLNNNNGDVSIDFSGTAQFDKGTSTLDARMKVDKSGGAAVMRYEKLELK